MLSHLALEQLTSLGLSTAMGCALGLVAHVYLLLCSGSRGLMVRVVDLGFWLLALVLTFLLALRVGLYQIGWAFFLGICSGVLVYRLCLSRWVRTVLLAVRNAVAKAMTAFLTAAAYVLSPIATVLVWPVRVFWRYLFHPLIYRPTIRLLTWWKKRREPPASV